MKVLVLGASGFVGSWVVRALLGGGADTTAIVRPTSNTWRIDDLSDLNLIARDDWKQAIVSAKPDVVVSLDWEGVAGTSRNDDSQWDNIVRQAEVIVAAADAGARRFIGVGSQAEYGPKDTRISESAAAEPRTTYGKAKLAAMESSRELCRARGVEWIWARIFSVFGPLDHSHWLLPSVADSLMSDRDIQLTSGIQQWSYLYAADAGTAFATLATVVDVNGIYNVGNPLAPELRGTIEQFATSFDSTARLLFGERAFGPDPVMRLEPDTSRLSDVGWSAKTELVDGLAMTARWLRGEVVADPFARGRSLPRRPM